MKNIYEILRWVTGPLLHGVLAFVCCLGSTASIVNVRFKYTIIYNIQCPLKYLPISVVESPKMQCSLYGVLNVVGRLCPCIGPGCLRCGLIWMWLDFIAHSSHTVPFTSWLKIMRIFLFKSNQISETFFFFSWWTKVGSSNALWNNWFITKSDIRIEPIKGICNPHLGIDASMNKRKCANANAVAVAVRKLTVVSGHCALESENLHQALKQFRLYKIHIWITLNTWFLLRYF